MKLSCILRKLAFPEARISEAHLKFLSSQSLGLLFRLFLLGLLFLEWQEWQFPTFTACTGLFCPVLSLQKALAGHDLALDLVRLPQDQGSRRVSHSHMKLQGLPHWEMMRNPGSRGLMSPKGEAKPFLKLRVPDQISDGRNQTKESWLTESRTGLEFAWNKKCFLP